MGNVMRMISIFRANVNEYFTGISQALFFRNPYFGLALLALSLAFDWRLFACGIAASLVGFVSSKTVRTPRLLKDSGLIPINGLFFGIAMASLFRVSPVFYGCLLLGALMVPLFTKAAFEVLQHWKLTPLVMPYIVLVWVFSLCGDGVALQPAHDFLGMRHVLPSVFLPEADLWIRLASSAALAMGRLFFLPDAFYGISLLVLIACFSPRKAWYFFLGTALATLVSFAVSSSVSPWEYGFSSYCAGIVGLGLASMPEKFRAGTILLFCAISVFLTMALDRLLGGLGLATLSLPYVLTAWFGRLSQTPRINVEWAPSDAA